MAKLSANGQTEIARVEIPRTLENGAPYKVVRALMSSGKLLEKTSLTGTPNHCGGWRMRGRVLASFLAPGVWVDHYLAKGWSISA